MHFEIHPERLRCSGIPTSPSSKEATGGLTTVAMITVIFMYVVLVVEPSKIIFLIPNTISQKEDIILLYIGYHSIPK